MIARMWEVRALGSGFDELLSWVCDDVLPKLEVLPQHVSSEVFSSTDHRRNVGLLRPYPHHSRLEAGALGRTGGVAQHRLVTWRWNVEDPAHCITVWSWVWL